MILCIFMVVNLNIEAMKKLCNVLFVVFIAILAMTSCSQDSLLDDGEELNAVHGIELRGRELANNLLASFENYVRNCRYP